VALTRTITGPLAQLDAATRQIAEAGKLRGEARIAASYNDEVGDLAENFNRMLDVLEELANAATQVADGDLSVRVEGEGDLQAAFRSMLRRLDDIVLRIRGTALEIASAAAEILAAAQEQEVASEQQSAGLREVGATVGSLGEAANEITKAASGVLEDAQQTYTSTDAVSRHIEELSRKAQGIGELLDLIAEIAERSDLLALNGSLEAVRAGEAGRGFALVAAEMRRLAERVTGTVTDVSEQVSGIRRATTSTVEATARSRRGAEDTAEASRRISQATQRQGRDTKQLVEAVAKLMEVADAATSATTQTRATAEGLRVYADELEQLTREFTLRDDEEG
jgi:methyl-accepting chemotaxis protein